MTLSTIRGIFQLVCLLYAFFSALLAMLVVAGVVPYPVSASIEIYIYVLVFDFIAFDLIAWFSQRHLLIAMYISGFYTASRIAFDATSQRYLHAQILSALFILIILLLGSCRLSHLWQKKAK
jgi:hypothetical protein